MRLLGIDLGTSSLKLLMRDSGGRIEKARAGYAEKGCEGWFGALCAACGQLDIANVDAVGLSAQVGTYIINGRDVIDWSSPVGFQELKQIKSEIPPDVFLREITMPHPDIVSYPMPRIKHIMGNFPDVRGICMPKETLIQRLTGNLVTDLYSWRGLANLDTGTYSGYMLDYLGVKDGVLPEIRGPYDRAGRVTREAASRTGIPEGTPVYLGCNDFFAALAGAGIGKAGDAFDITGTSEHLGGIADALLADTPLVSGKYFSGFVRYGVTGSSGAAVTFARELHSGGIDLSACRGSAPLFLPYLNGERCPVCDPEARGVFFGISGGCDGETMAYSVLEGVCFNLKQIYEMLGLAGDRVAVCGGAARDDALNQLKADILGVRIIAREEPDASALGAALIAGVACGAFSDLNAAYAVCAGGERIFEPRGNCDYAARYALFRGIYPALRDQFQEFGRLKA